MLRRSGSDCGDTRWLWTRLKNKLSAHPYLGFGRAVSTMLDMSCSLSLLSYQCTSQLLVSLDAVQTVQAKHQNGHVDVGS